MWKGNNDYRWGDLPSLMQNGCKKVGRFGGGGKKALIALYSFLEDRRFSSREKSLPGRHEMSTDANKKPYELPWWLAVSA